VRQSFWILFAAQSWALWLIRNKLTIENSFPKQPADYFYKTAMFLQLWRPLLKEKHADKLDVMVGVLRSLYRQTRLSQSQVQSVPAWFALLKLLVVCVRRTRQVLPCEFRLCVIVVVSNLMLWSCGGFINLKLGRDAFYLKDDYQRYSSVEYLENACQYILPSRHWSHHTNSSK
jgi:hypothetical protein